MRATTRFGIIVLLATWLGIATSATAHAQSWIAEMFEETSHDFGVVPRGAEASYRFQFKNRYEEDVHVVAVRSSCGCTEPAIEKSTLKTYETGAILCKFNTRSFVGRRSAVVTVVFDRPYYGEIQLLVQGTIRSDIVTSPGEVEFGEVPQGTEASKTIRVTYAGRRDWEIRDVRSVNEHLGVRLQRLPDTTGQVTYELRVRLKDDAPAGPINDQIVLVTNDANYNLVTVPVRGTVMPPLVMPQSVELGTIPSGVTVKKSMFIKGESPFAIVDVQCDDPRFKFDLPTGTLKAHLIRFEFSSGDQEGAFRRKVTVKTTMDGGSEASTTIRGNVSAQNPQ